MFDDIGTELKIRLISLIEALEDRIEAAISNDDILTEEGAAALAERTIAVQADTVS